MAFIKKQTNGSQEDSFSVENMQSPTPNTQNLFDDSNSKDKKWLKLAIKHLAKADRLW